MGALKMQDMKMQDMKLTDQCAGHEIAGHENAGHEITGHAKAKQKTSYMPILAPIREFGKITADWA